MKYQRIPVIVDAVRFVPSSRPWPAAITEPSCICAELAQDGDRCQKHKRGEWTYGYVRTHEGRKLIEAGDWLITELGAVRVCKPEMFEATYAPVKEDGP